MKKLISIVIVILSVLFIVNALNINQLSVRKGNSINKPIPDGVLKIVKKSCLKCHTEPGKVLILEKLDFTTWEKYTSEKQAVKAKAMCDMVTGKKMPPEKFRTNHPDSIPTMDDVKTICDWAESLQVIKK